MNSDLLAIFIGNNSKNLLGCENDAKLFYNLDFIKNKYLLLDEDVTVENLEIIFQNNKNIKNLLFFYSGHGLFGGTLLFNEDNHQRMFKKIKLFKPIFFYELINKYFLNEINLIIILDCCFAGSFPHLNNFQKIKNTVVIASCAELENSSESLAEYNELDFQFIKPDIIFNKNIIIGAFTYNFIKIIKQKNLININEWITIKNEKIWKTLQLIINQQITIIK